jgi:hypothetical protein
MRPRPWSTLFLVALVALALSAGCGGDELDGRLVSQLEGRAVVGRRERDFEPRHHPSELPKNTAIAKKLSTRARKTTSRTTGFVARCWARELALTKPVRSAAQS